MEQMGVGTGRFVATVGAVKPQTAKAKLRTVAQGRRVENIAGREGRDRSFVVHLERWLAASMVDGGVVVTFDAMPGEVDLSPLKSSDLLRSQNISFAITRTPEIGFDLTVHPVSAQMERHRYGYHQPVAGSEQTRDEKVDVVLVPALGFDETGNRLGHGAGYYDRFLARVPRALRVGIADVLLDQPLPTEHFDIPMTHLATPDGVVSV